MFNVIFPAQKRLQSLPPVRYHMGTLSENVGSRSVTYIDGILDPWAFRISFQNNKNSVGKRFCRAENAAQVRSLLRGEHELRGAVG